MTTLAYSPSKVASPDFPIEVLISKRWSPYGFSEKLVPKADLSSIFEAARWAPSSYNEQPWSYIVSTRDNPDEFARILSCLLPGNQDWAKAAPVIAVSVINLRFSKTDKENRAAAHDLGLASANLVLEATARGLSVHQMIGILPDHARELYQIPEHSEAWTALAIGYKASLEDISATLRVKDLTSRHRKPISQFVFNGSWGNPSPITNL